MYHKLIESVRMCECVLAVHNNPVASTAIRINIGESVWYDRVINLYII